MPIEEFRLQNFMAFGDTGWIKLRKINLVFGRNSSGKSVIIRALRLMKQSVLTGGKGQPLVFSAEGGVDVGSFETMVHKKPESHLNAEDEAGELSSDEEREKEKREQERREWSEIVTFGFRGYLKPEKKDDHQAQMLDLPQDTLPLEMKRLGEILDYPVSEMQEGLQFEVNVSYRQQVGSKQCLVWQINFCARRDQATDEADQLLGCDFDDIGFDTVEYRFSSQVLREFSVQLQERIEESSFSEFLPDINLNQFVEPPDDESITPIRDIEWFCGECKNEIRHFLESIVHLGPVRPHPQRTYIITDEIYREWQIRGWQSFLDYLKKQDDDRDKKVEPWLRNFDLGKKLISISHHMKRVGNFHGVYELLLDESGQGDLRNLTDVGFGASQIIPVVVQCFSAARDALILVEQPELHLHPKAQADLADMFIECASELLPVRSEFNPRQLEGTPLEEAKEYQPAERRFWVETHSEHMLLHLQRRVAETTYVARQLEKSQAAKNQSFSVEKDYFNLVFVRRNGGISFTEFLEVDDKGELDAPSMEFQLFFDAAYQEVVGLSEVKRKLEALEVSNEIGD